MKIVCVLLLSILVGSLSEFFSPTRQTEVVSHMLTFLHSKSTLKNAYFAASLLNGIGYEDMNKHICSYLTGVDSSSGLDEAFFVRKLNEYGGCSLPFAPHSAAISNTITAPASIQDMSYAVMISEMEEISYDVSGVIEKFESMLDPESHLFYSSLSKSGTSTMENTLIAMDAIMEMSETVKELAETSNEDAADSFHSMVSLIRFQCSFRVKISVF